MGQVKKVILVILCMLTTALGCIVNISAYDTDADGASRLYYDEPWTIWCRDEGDAIQGRRTYINVLNPAVDNWQFFTYQQNFLACDDRFYMGEFTGIRQTDADGNGLNDLIYSFEFYTDENITYQWGNNIYEEVAKREVEVIFYNAYNAYINPNNIALNQTTIYAEEPYDATQIANGTEFACFYFTFNQTVNSESASSNLALMNGNQCIGWRVTLRNIDEDFVYQTYEFPNLNNPYQNIWMNGYAHDEAMKYYNNGYKHGQQDGFDQGYQKAYEKYYEQDIENFSIWELMNGIVTSPIAFLKEALGFEIFGVNLFGFVQFLLTALLVLFIVVTIVRMVL